MDETKQQTVQRLLETIPGIRRASEIEPLHNLDCLEELTSLEDLVSDRGSFPREKVDWFKHAIEDNNIKAVVLPDKDLDNWRLPVALAEMGFVESAVTGRHRILIRRTPAPDDRGTDPG